MELKEVIKEKLSKDEEQLNFIFSDKKNIIVIAPAGCGKTTAMITKIAWELSTGHIHSNKKVLAMTFSVNAAMKIKDSLKILLPDLVSNPTYYLSKVDVANYHNFAMRVLFKHGYCLNSEFMNLSDFQVVDDADKNIKDNLDEMELEMFQKLNITLKASNKIDLENVINNYWIILNKKLITKHIITYNGILVAAIKLLQKEQIKKFYKKYYEMVIVDEFQDTNLLGYLLICELIGDNISIFLGDDVQKIYGFMGAVEKIFDMISTTVPTEVFEFKNNYRFKKNNRIRELDSLIRNYAECYKPSDLNATILLKQLDDDEKENQFIVEGINKIITESDNKVAVLVRAAWQGNSIVEFLNQNGVPYFNALFSDSDIEFKKFYSIAMEEFHKNVLGRAVQRDLKKCLNAVKKRESEAYIKPERKYVFDSLYKLLEILFNESRKWEGTSKERYENIDFILSNNGLKHMMEYVKESVILSTIHSEKGLEWDYVIIPKLNFNFMNYRNVCKPCHQYGCYEIESNYCKFQFKNDMKKAFIDEIRTFYVAITRAKKDVFMTASIGFDKYNKHKKINCLLNLEGIEKKDYDWDKALNFE